jgi:CHAT domain-containing protein/tetratricopeptide (TPR) repeat protein
MLCRTLATILVAADDPATALPEALPCDPLDLLVALHEIAVAAMLVDQARGQRAAAAAWIVAGRAPDAPLLQAQAHWTQASAILYLPDYARSLAHYDAALAWYGRACAQLAPATPARDVRAVHVVRVFCLTELGRYREALEAVTAAERWLQDHPHPYAQLTLLLNQSLLAGSRGDFLEMVQLADATVKLATEMGEQARAAQGWLNRAYACFFLGRFDDAREALDCGLAAAAATGETLTIARAQVIRARLLRCRGQLFAALTELHAAERGFAQAAGEAATIALEQAALYEQLRQLPEARRVAHFAAEQFARQSMPSYSASAALHAARIAIQQGQTSTTQAMLRLAHTQAEQIKLPTLAAEIAVAEAELALVPAAHTVERGMTRRLRAARTAARRAVATLQQHGLVQEAVNGLLAIAALDSRLGATEQAIAAYRRLLDHPIRPVQLTALAALGMLLPPAEALPYLQRAADLTVEQRRTLPMEEIQARYSSETSMHHLRLAACYLALGDATRALESVWAGKAGPLLDLRATSGSLDGAAMAALEGAKADLARYRERKRDHLGQAHDAALQEQHERAAYHMARALAASAEVLEHERRLTEQLRLLGDRNGQARVPQVAEVQAALPVGAALLEYVQIDDELYGFLLRPQQPLAYRRLGSYRELVVLLDRWKIVCHRLTHDQHVENALQQIQVALAPLRDRLLAPWAMQLAADQLVIAPTGALHDIPWAALADGSPDLSPHCAITLTPCGALCTAPPEVPPRALAPPRLLGYAGDEARHLAYVPIELETIARHLPDAQVWPAARAADLRAEPAPRLLHLAAHALTNPALPLCSTIELADGPILLLEAHRLNLRGTRLVTLSACETGVQPECGEMVLALAGAFICAGAQAVLASLWEVSDAATAALMDGFYAALAAGVTLPLALRHAQQAVRAHAPLDWMAFQLWAGTSISESSRARHVSSKPR